ncbi:unnamed protein product [Diatraea saccharalis]|uniref:Sulfatase N-terminal domain-containing protein n=1 Tax=Diatraea saccharalis TaxID=40085 RepID=A0A9N9RF22_9NEOP|nr:unnamed protein product [Diatraea saccharalis]CAG9795257.1 unnamed protein product [Diatraea saccharalis]
MLSFYVLIILLIVSFVVCVKVSPREKDSKRNIVLIVADDLGWNDVSVHGSDQVLTPNIDSLGYHGVTLGRYYSNCICTPSRAALLSGKYAYTTGMQGWPLTGGEDRGLPVTHKILPQYLKELGYATHLVGKWHVGSSREEYLPTKRGFDSHFGHRLGSIDYYEYTYEENWTIGKVSGMNMFRNQTAAWDAEGYATDLYNNEAISIINSHDETKPLFLMLAHLAPHSANEGALLQAPPEVVRSMRHVESPERRIFAAMVKKLDDSVGDVVEALSRKGILNNTIIVFISDNGGMTSGVTVNYGSNYPLRGIKLSPYEGGVRVNGAIWAPENVASHLYEGYVHVTDWLPTLLKAAGRDPPKNIDGHDLWNKIMKNKVSSRSEIVDIDDMQGYASIISKNYKLITGTVFNEYSNYQGKELLGVIGNPPCYIDAIKNSKAYKVFTKMGRSVPIDISSVRNALKIECQKQIKADDVICYPGNGTVCLYNIKKDPCETTDLSKEYPELVNKMLKVLNIEKKRVIPRVPTIRQPRANPVYFNYTWDVFVDVV